jgi:hypothetical protein
MPDDIDEAALIRHIVGATVVHVSPFTSIEVPSSMNALSQEEVDKWVAPVYLEILSGRFDVNSVYALRSLYADITPSTVGLLLEDYNWRPRITGAFFSALKGFESFEDQIGRLLLRSDLCFAGRHYCVTLAKFNSAAGVKYLQRYLDYYLTRPDLDYDQGDAMGALAYLDARNGTSNFQLFQTAWNSYAANGYKPKLENSIAEFREKMDAIENLGGQLSKQ